MIFIQHTDTQLDEWQCPTKSQCLAIDARGWTIIIDHYYIYIF